MIVIPPSSDHLSYFTGLAANVWENSLRDKATMCDELRLENKTLIISCDINNDTHGIIEVKLHYRYVKKQLYCFIEEPDY
jgi:hypothetical protein